MTTMADPNQPNMWQQIFGSGQPTAGGAPTAGASPGGGMAAGLLNNPLFGMGIGLLSGGAPGGTFAGGAQQGLRNAMLMQQANSRNQLMNLQIQQATDAKQRLEDQRARVESLAKKVEAPSAYDQPEGQTFPGEAPIPGLQNAASPQAQIQADLMRAAPETYLDEAIKSQFGTPTQPKTFQGGAEGDPSMKQNYMLGPNGQAIAVGPPYKPTASTSFTINPADAGIKINDLKYWKNEEGKSPMHLVGLPAQQAVAQAQAEGFNPVSASGEKLQAQQQIANTIQQEGNELLFGENGIYADWGKNPLGIDLPPWGEKITETGKAAWENFVQNDPRYKQYIDFAEGTLSPLAKSLGEAGALAEGDTDRARKLLPVLKGWNIDTPEVAEAKMARLTRIIARGEENQAAGNKPAQDEFEDTWYHKGKQYRMKEDGTVEATGKKQRRKYNPETGMIE